ncbi:hypothetical protein [Corynebacterium amycolatum]|uniref:hypothetical protein n=1 Tax=Corynebacterium amycolatum TaxID=43765 RepID=UPI002159E311|nr:hypothetical protein [Corynebacterium amycolatum]UVE00683.1 hypothetical protein NU639_00570 [Corynebacterium amycolatum]
MTPSLIPEPFGADHTPETPTAIPMPELPVAPDYITPPLPSDAPMTELRGTTTVTHEDAKGSLTSVAVVCGVLGFMLMGVSLWLTLILWGLAGGAWWLRTDPTTTEEAVYRVPLESPAHRLWSGTGESAGLDAARLQRTIRQAADTALAADRVPYGHEIEVTKLLIDDDESGDVIVGLSVPSLLTTDELQVLALEAADDLRVTGICGAERTADEFFFFLTSMNAQHYNVHITEPPKAPEPPKPAGPRFSKA